MDGLRPSRFFVSSCRQGPIPIYLLRGAISPAGEQGSMIIAGLRRLVDYFPHRFFSAPPRHEIVGEEVIWRLGTALENHRAQADLIIVAADRVSAGLFPRRNYLRLPSLVDARMAVPTDDNAFAKSNDGIISDLRRLRRHQYEWKITSSAAEFDLFYERFYLPYVRLRHGDLAIAQDREWLRYRYPQGEVLWTMRKGAPVAGNLICRRGDTLISVLNGVLDGDPERLKAGALAAIYMQSLEYARQLGCRYFDLGGCRPSLHDGVLRFKRKMGITLLGAHDAHDFLIRWNAWTPGVAAFLAGTGLIYRENGGFSAVAALNSTEPATQEDADRTHHMLWTGGLQRLSLVSSAGWRADVAPPPHTLLHGPVGITDLLCP